MRRLVAIWILSAALAHAGKLTFEQERKPLEISPDATTVSADFAFKNETSQPVVIRKYKADCSCMAVEVKGAKLRYEPGESGVVRANFDVSAISGTVEKNAMLWLDQDGEEKPSVRLTVDLQVNELIKIEPRALKWELNTKVDSQVIRFEISEGQAIKLGSVKASNPLFKHELKTLEEGKRYELTVSPSSTAAAAYCQFTIETDSKFARYKTLQVFAVVRRPLPKESP